MKFHGHYFSEVDDYAIGVYKKRFPEAVPLGDVRNIRGKELPEGRWIITGGFPCQDISVAGNKAGLEGERSGLFSEYIRLIGEIRPAFAIMENVGNLASWFDTGEGRYPPPEALVEGGKWSMEVEQYQGIAKCIGSLSEIGYDAEWAVIRASDVGAPHRRDRFWIAGYPRGGGCGGGARRRAGTKPPHGHLQLETRNPDRNANGINKQEKQEICGGENSKPRGICTNVADTGCKGIHESGIAEVAGGGCGESGRVYGYGVPGGEEEKRKNMADTGSHGLETPRAAEQPAGFGGCSEKIPDPRVLDDDASGYGTGQICGERSPESEVSRSGPDADSQRRQELIDRITARAADADSPSCRNGIGNFWAVEPSVGRVANGVSSRVDRLKGLGNGVVPQIPQLILEEIKEEFYCD
jgi:DNA (cytosine-5)-methyltransferase 1